MEDSKNFPGGKNYQTTINNEMKQIFSYIPREARKYQEMVHKRLILRAPQAQQPRSQVQQNQHPQPRQTNQISQQQEQRQVIIMFYDV